MQQLQQQAQEIQQNIPKEKIQELINTAIGGLQPAILFYDIENNKYIVSDYDYNHLNNDYSYIYIDHIQNTNDIVELLSTTCSCCLDCPHTEKDQYECIITQIQEHYKTDKTTNEIKTNLYYHHLQQTRKNNTTNTTIV